MESSDNSNKRYQTIENNLNTTRREKITTPKYRQMMFHFIPCLNQMEKEIFYSNYLSNRKANIPVIILRGPSSLTKSSNLDKASGVLA